MLDGDNLKERFEQFVHSIEDGTLVLDAVMVLAYVDPATLDDDTTTYAQAVFGRAPVHRVVGLLRVAEGELMGGAN